MKSRFIKKFLASLFLAATFLGAVHHHDDTGIHHDCPIYILNAGIVSPDLPRDTLLGEIETVYRVLLLPVPSYAEKRVYTTYFGRAPPHFS
ncbi:hypothetical protein [Sulfurovum riftiae]|uniref:hypothetical protein n=1 Tax=Sulfurovum riftiae TaxID=1630136 RepID=UPI00128ED6AA|nr:hypothetical protein [Sulfurovum riftiae]